MSTRSFYNPWALTPFTQQPWRALRAASVGEASPLILEIGAGVGFHGIQLAKSHPEAFVVCVERTQEKAEKMLRRFEHHPELTNLYGVRAWGEQWVCENLQPAEVDAVHLLYPNPYPKPAHQNKRFMHMPFMAMLLSVMKPGATLLLATNERFYFEEAREAFCERWGMGLLHGGPITPGPDFTPRSHFEKKYLDRGEVCYELLLEKRVNSLSAFV